jgi:hypothetical protein
VYGPPASAVGAAFGWTQLFSTVHETFISSSRENGVVPSDLVPVARYVTTPAPDPGVDEFTETVEETAAVRVPFERVSQLPGMLIVGVPPIAALSPEPVTESTETVTVVPFWKTFDVA